jgi:hypothetical protein
MDRRDFLGALGAIGLYPIGARAFGTNRQQISEPSKPLPATPKKIEKPVRPVRVSRLWQCVVGDFQMTRNGHLYSRRVWENRIIPAISGLKFVALGMTETSSLPLDKIAGVVTNCWIREDKVHVEMKTTDTPSGNILQGLLAEGAVTYLTPCGVASHIGADGIVPDDYAFNHFNATTDSAFECATPLVPSEERTLYAKTANNN